MLPRLTTLMMTGRRSECVESLHTIQTGQLVRLSTQEVADCCSTTGMMPKDNSFGCIAALKGLCREQDYISPTHRCDSEKCPVVAKVTGSKDVETKREDLMLEAIHECPLMAFLDASLVSFQSYTGGIYDDPDCSSSRTNHAVQLVGYGSDIGVDYWIAKNSWGVKWGDKGYFYLNRGNNRCGIANNVSYPVNS